MSYCRKTKFRGRRKEGCKFFIGKTIAGKNITGSIVKKLITGKSTGVIKGFKSKSGKSFDAVLILKDRKVTFDFQN
ncbi:hypothetical protein GTH52_15120 (plasmid) [Clostridium tyrobutyricum]|uniref:topoisomerase C-terminal repeat-containing protein n=1 Tax=Clostridium tyrobutyricum TaxID=1519 RepID=UPI0009C0B7B9|nr:topoisomerase C-terminal repeat-containing protein [Clostridium tyrobutyricum]QNB68250.1 hypothetical protein GTH52_15120 [Clostridium tyrobutyricum]